jgi:hypothetical protein
LVFGAVGLALACRDETPVAPPGPNVVGAVVSVVVSAPRQVLAPGDSVQFTSQAFDAQGRVLPTATVTWSSSNPAAATVDSRGMATAIAAGTTKITATSSGQSGSADLIVSVTQLCECTRIIDSTATELVQRNDSTGIYVFRVLGGQQPAIDSGSIIVGAENGGYLRRVNKATRSGDMITVETSVAYLEEAVQEGAFATTSSTDGDTVSLGVGSTRWGEWTTTYIAPGLTSASSQLCCSLNGLNIKFEQTYLQPISADFTVKEGDIDFLPRLEMSSNFSGFQLQDFRAVFHGGLGLNIDEYEFKVTGELKEEFKMEKKFKKFITKQKPFATFIGPMPVVGTITLTISLEITPSVSASAVFGGKFRTGFGLTGGMQWNRGPGWSPVTGSSAYFEAPAPEFKGVEATTSVKIAVVPELSVEFYGFAGPTVEVEPYAEAVGQANLSFKDGTPTGLDWETKVAFGMNLNIGAKISLLGRIDLAEVKYPIPIVKPRRLVRAFSDGPLTVYTQVTGEDRPDSIFVQLRPAFVDTAPPLGRDLATSSQDATIAANDSAKLVDIRSGTSFRHTVKPVNLIGNCTFGPPRDTLFHTAQFAERADTVAISSGTFMALGGKPAVDTLKIDCIPLGSLLVRTLTTGQDATARSRLLLERLDKSGAGKGTPAETLQIPGGDTPPDTVIGGLTPKNPANGASGAYLATLDPGRKNCAVAKPASHQPIILSGDTVSTDFRIRCVALGHARASTKTVDPDAGAPSDPVVYTLAVVDQDTASGALRSQNLSSASAQSTLGASAAAVVSSLVPLYNASGATGRHTVTITDAPNRCREVAGFTRPVTVFSGDTALADFAVQCVERLHVAALSTGPGTDSDGYVVVVENANGTADSVAIATTDTVGIAGVTPGLHTIRLGDVDGNCVMPASVQRDVSGRDSTLVSFSVNCPGPPAPVGLQATLVESARIDLAWTPAPNAAPVAVYRLYRSTVGVPGSAIVVDSIPALTYSDTGLPEFTRFSYQVAAVDANGLVGPKSTALIVRTLDGSPPSPPSGLNAVPVSGFVIRLAWGAATDPQTGISKYRVYRDGVLIDSTTTTTYLSAGLTPMTAYTYQVMAVNGAGLDGPLSAPATATTLDTPPTVPTGLIATAAGTTRINLAWSAAADPESGIAGYRVYRGGVLVGVSTTTIFADSGLTPATTYTYEVSAVNGSRVEGPRSGPATATTDTPPVATGDLTVVVQTGGSDIPSTGYQVHLSAAGFQLDRPAAPNDTLLYSALVAQAYTLRLSGLPSNCEVVDGTNPRTVTVVVGSTTSTTLFVACR